MENINILVIYSNSSGTMRRAVRDLLYCYRKYSKCNCYYLNIGNGKIPKFFLNQKFNIIIYHVLFFSDRSTKKFSSNVELLKKLRDQHDDTISIIQTQDEYFYLDKINNFVNEFNINYIHTVMPETEWHKIFKDIDFSKTKIKRILTGYIDDQSLKKIIKYNNTNKEIGIVYRASKNLPCLGRQALLKSQLADIFSKACDKWAISYDISTENKDAILGNNWYKFLSKGKYTVGIEGGASILDYNGIIWDATLEYLKKMPDATFEEVEAAIFPGYDGNANLVALSPRHLEACITKTCQILIEGEYNGILKPSIHYIELKRDFSNLDEVMRQLSDENLRANIVNRAYKDIVESNLFTYETFVSELFQELIPNYSECRGNKMKQVYIVNYIYDYIVRKSQILNYRIISRMNKMLSPQLKKRIKKILNFRYY